MSTYNFYTRSKRIFAQHHGMYGYEFPTHIEYDEDVWNLQEHWALGRSLNVVHVGPCFTYGGAEQQAIDLSRALHPSRAVIKKFLVTRPELVNPSRVNSVETPVEIADVNTIRKAACEHDILLFWGVELDEYLASYPRTAKTIYIAHGVADWVNRTLLSSLRSTDHIVAVSRMVREALQCSLPISIIPNGVDAKRIASSRSRRAVRADLGFDQGDFVAGVVGRFAPEKRFELLIQALHCLPSTYKGLFIGDGPLRDDLLRLANRLIPGRYCFRFAKDYLGDFYKAMDSFCLVSESEGFALVLMEAMMCGKPVLSTGVGSAPELIRQRQNGVIVDPEPEAIAAVLCDIAESPEWAEGMGASAAKVADELGHSFTMARCYENLFADLLSPSASAS